MVRTSSLVDIPDFRGDGQPVGGFQRRTLPLGGCARTEQVSGGTAVVVSGIPISSARGHDGVEGASSNCSLFAVSISCLPPTAPDHSLSFVDKSVFHSIRGEISKHYLWLVVSHLVSLLVVAIRSSQNTQLRSQVKFIA